MSGRTARAKRRAEQAAMSDEVTWVDAYDAFGQVLMEMMTEYGFDDAPKRFYDAVIAECCAYYRDAQDEWILGLLYGDDEQAKTREIIAASVELTYAQTLGGLPWRRRY